MIAFHGRCHCGAIAFTFETARAPREWAIRACQCGFCRAHGARTTTDPAGSVSFEIADPAKLTRYRFGTRSSDFLVCAECGVYVAAVLTTPRGQFATLNTNTIQDAADVPQPTPVSYDDESPAERSARREARWTPVGRL
jgi:hypothetical protein